MGGTHKSGHAATVAEAGRKAELARDYYEDTKAKELKELDKKEVEIVGRIAKVVKDDGFDSEPDEHAHGKNTKRKRRRRRRRQRRKRRSFANENERTRPRRRQRKGRKRNDDF